VRTLWCKRHVARYVFVKHNFIFVFHQYRNINPSEIIFTLVKGVNEKVEHPLRKKYGSLLHQSFAVHLGTTSSLVPSTPLEVNTGNFECLNPPEGWESRYNYASKAHRFESLRFRPQGKNFPADTVCEQLRRSESSCKDQCQWVTTAVATATPTPTVGRLP
jgi:hypothetical protein